MSNTPSPTKKAQPKANTESHQVVQRSPWGDIPVRPFLPEDGLPDDWQEEVLDIIRRHLALV